MKKSILILIVLLLSACFDRHKENDLTTKISSKKNFITVSGCYKTVTSDSIDSEVCPLELVLNKSKKEYHYILKTTDTTYSGRAVLDFEKETKTTYVVLKGIEWAAFEGDLNKPENSKKNTPNTKEISLSLVSDTLTFMNEGNSMNSFTILKDCGRKWVQLIKQ